MANEEHLARLREGRDAWNAWRKEHPDIVPDLSEADLQGVQLQGANLRRANCLMANLAIANLTGAQLHGASLRRADLQGAVLKGAQLQGANLRRANCLMANLEKACLFKANLRRINLNMARLSGVSLRKMHLPGVDLGGADLRSANLYKVDLRGAHLVAARIAEANLRKAKLTGANLSGAILTGAKLYKADLSWTNLNSAIFTNADLSGANLESAILCNAYLGEANFSGANLRRANLSQAILISTDFKNADLTGCRIYGISAWGLELKEATQRDLVITKPDEPEITVDNLEVAQFLYLMLHNEKIRDVIDTITSKAVLILGRFTDERKAVLNSIREELRKRDYLPVLFDFDKPDSKDLTGTVSTLANMARFIIADLTDPSCIPHELAMVIPTTVVPVQPILFEGMREYAMFIDLKKRYHWVLKPFSYSTQEHLIAELSGRVIGPAEAKVRELRG